MNSEASCSNQSSTPSPNENACGSKRNHDQKPNSPSSSDLPPDKRPKTNAYTTKDQSILRVIDIDVSNTIDANVSSDISSEGTTTEKGTDVKSTKPKILNKAPEEIRPLPAHVRSFPSEINLVRVGERHWMCGICRAAVFENFAEACMHEMACKSRNAMTYPCIPTQSFPISSYHAPSMFPPVVSNPFVSGNAKPRLPTNHQIQQFVRQPSGVASVQPSVGVVQPPSKLYPNGFVGGGPAKASGSDVGKGGLNAPNCFPPTEILNVSLIPEQKGVLSDYNYILSKNIQFFETPVSCNSVNDSNNTSALPDSKVGLRCIHCASYQRHITAASFFPSSISSISSGMGTIGSRHFLGGKCPFLPKDTFDELKRTKKMSQQQTRTQGRIGLDAYCRDLAKTRKIFDNEYGGIYFAPNNLGGNPGIEKKAPAKVNVPKKAHEKKSLQDTKVTLSKIVTRKSNSVPKLYSGTCSVVKPVTPKDPVPNRKDPSAFKEGELEHFWECKHCKSLPLQWRATGSVVFSVDAPTIDIVGRHLSVCQGSNPLRIPRDASMKLEEDVDGATKVIVHWDNIDNKRKSHRIKGAKLIKKRRSKSSIVSSGSDTPSLPLKPGVEDALLATGDDKSLTTDFAYFTIQQMKKCYLTKAGGSRGNCPVGYPGLACSHCVGDSGERRFFYTSADHLRNSFSHIPSHLMTCTKCPQEVKEKIESFKSVRNKQKSQLRGGDHKVFIDRVWGRLHGPGGGVIAPIEDNQDVTDDYVTEEEDRSVSSVTIEVPYEPDEFVTESLDGRYLENKKIAIETHKSPMLSSSDRKLVTDYVYYSLLQMVPKQYQRNGSGDLEELEEDEDDNEDDDEDGDEDITGKGERKKEDVADTCVPTKGKKAEDIKVEKIVESTSEDPRVPVRRDPIAVSTPITTNVSMIVQDTSKKAVTSKCDADAMKVLEQASDCNEMATIIKYEDNEVLSEKAPRDKIDTIAVKCEDKEVVPEKIAKEAHNLTVTKSESNIETIIRTVDNDKAITEGKESDINRTEVTEKEQNSEDDDEEMPEIVETLVCKHCMNECMQCDFLPESAEDLRKHFAEIPKHLMSCPKVPDHVKSKLQTLKAFRAVQESMLKRGAQKRITNTIWRRVEKHFSCDDDTPASAPEERDFSSDVLATTLLSESDRTLVSEFTFYTMQQMEPCILENSGNGARSMFAFGFPGLACKHCAGKPNARKFFYRTPDILSGNYAHIPNHVMSCKHTPFEIKQTLAGKKRVHQEQKQRLQRGSQRIFFNNVWDRLHKRKG